jgi:phosphopantetheine adenylyltransferase
LAANNYDYEIRTKKLEETIVEVEARANHFEKLLNEVIQERDNLKSVLDSKRDSREVDDLRTQVQSMETSHSTQLSEKDRLIQGLEANVKHLLESAAERESALTSELSSWMAKYETERVGKVGLLMSKKLIIFLDFT